jgi:hypothetical protein
MAMTSTSMVPLIVVAIIMALRPSSIQFERLKYLESTIWKIERFGPCILQDWLKLFNNIKTKMK